MNGQIYYYICISIYFLNLFYDEKYLIVEHVSYILCFSNAVQSSGSRAFTKGSEKVRFSSHSPEW